MKGATVFDKKCHSLFDIAMEYTAHDTGVPCKECGRNLRYIYCEERLYLIRCKNCKIVGMAKAPSPSWAASMVFGDLEKMVFDDLKKKENDHE